MLLNSLIQQEWPGRQFLIAKLEELKTLQLKDFVIKTGRDPLSIGIETPHGRSIQRIQIDSQHGAFTFELGDAPVLAFGEGGPQFDRRGSNDQLRSGQPAAKDMLERSGRLR